MIKTRRGDNMKLWELRQIEDRDPSLYAHTTIVRAKTEKKARDIAQENEDTQRDGELCWDATNATCEKLDEDGEQGIILCA